MSSAIEGFRKRLTAMVVADWPAAGFVDTEIGCFMKPEVADGKTTVWS
jgi:hypothetical protein